GMDPPALRRFPARLPGGATRCRGPRRLARTGHHFPSCSNHRDRGDTVMKRSRFAPTLGAAAVAAAFGLAGLSTVQAQENFRIGVVSFLSGQAAESFGIPAVNGAKLLVDAFNNGTAPAPYDKKGFGGMPIEAIYVDEAGGAT